MSRRRSANPTARTKSPIALRGERARNRAKATREAAKRAAVKAAEAVTPKKANKAKTPRHRQEDTPPQARGTPRKKLRPMTDTVPQGSQNSKKEEKKKKSTKDKKSRSRYEPVPAAKQFIASARKSTDKSAPATNFTLGDFLRHVMATMRLNDNPALLTLLRWFKRLVVSRTPSTEDELLALCADLHRSPDFVPKEVVALSEAEEASFVEVGKAVITIDRVVPKHGKTNVQKSRDHFHPRKPKKPTQKEIDAAQKETELQQAVAVCRAEAKAKEDRMKDENAKLRAQIAEYEARFEARETAAAAGAMSPAGADHDSPLVEFLAPAPPSQTQATTKRSLVFASLPDIVDSDCEPQSGDSDQEDCMPLFQESQGSEFPESQ